jgi:hypothetical protein
MGDSMPCITGSSRCGAYTLVCEGSDCSSSSSDNRAAILPCLLVHILELPAFAGSLHPTHSVLRQRCTASFRVLCYLAETSHMHRDGRSLCGCDGNTIAFLCRVVFGGLCVVGCRTSAVHVGTADAKGTAAISERLEVKQQSYGLVAATGSS